MSDCLTCAKSIGCGDQSFAVGANQEIQNALCKHFWFGENQYLKSTICYPCWHKIEDFHRFYCEVEELYSKQMLPHVQLLEVKQENIQYDFVPEEPQHPLDEFIKSEGDEACMNNSEDPGGDDADYKQKNNSKRPRLKKHELDAVQEYVSRQLVLDCDSCSKRCTTFDTLQKHSTEEHEKKATVVCCNLKLTNKYRFVDHIRFHLDPNQFKCSHCSKQFENRDALRRHAREHTLKVENPVDDEPSVSAVVGNGNDRSDDEPDDDENYEQESDDSEESINSEDDDEDDKDFSTSSNSKKRVKTHKTSVAKTDDGQCRPRKAGADNEKMIAENVNLECDTCKKKFTTFLSLQKHSKAEHKKLAYVFCCSLKFKKKPRLIDHILYHLDPSRFRCKICHKSLCHSESLKRHMDKNHAPEEAKTLQCSMCPKMFTHQKFLNTHIRYHNRRWHCEICNKRFICEATLKVHHKSIHTKELKYVCHVCARTFHIYSTYRSHLETHDESAKKKPPKPRVQCSVCNAWTQKLGHHMLLHSGTQTCDICGKECKNEISYRYHMKNHETGDHMCSVCGKGFKREITLKEHMASHTGDVLYSCDFCDRTFNSNANKASHRKKMHPQQWLEDKIKKKAAKLAQSEGAVQL
nr:PR domain zinc finger protein 5-like [Aedes albopictus]